MNPTRSDARPSAPARRPALRLALTGLACAAFLSITGCAANQKCDASCSSGCSQDQAACSCKAPGVIAFKVEGLECTGCAKELEEALLAVPGVKTAKVCFDDSKAFVTLDKDHPASTASIEAAIAKRQKEHLSLENDPNCTKPKG
jgi:copper chaperone